MQVQIYGNFLNTKNFFAFFCIKVAFFYKMAELLSKILSKIVIAAIASTTGTALGKTQGSCRPRAVKVVGFPSRSIVCCSCKMVATGLKATRK